MRQRNAPKLRAVVDTNVFISAVISSSGLPATLVNAWRARKFELVLSDEQLGELNDVLSRERLFRRYPATDLERVSLRKRLASVPTVARATPPLPIRDPKDEMILAAAFGGGADYIVTGDADLLVLDGDPRLGHLQIVTAGDFLALLSAPSEAGSSS